MFDFDEIIDRRGTHCAKWDMMESIYGVPSDDGIAMWVADMDFPPAAGGDRGAPLPGRPRRLRLFRRRPRLSRGDHGLDVAAAWLGGRSRLDLHSHGLVAGVALCLNAFTEKGDGVILFTPVYHAFARIIKANERVVVESPLVQRDGRRDGSRGAGGGLTGRERMVILCSPHNPGGRVWTPDELGGLADFCAAHLLLVSDEIHHDLVLPGHRHTVAPLAAPGHLDRLVMLTATSKTFQPRGRDDRQRDHLRSRVAREIPEGAGGGRGLAETGSGSRWRPPPISTATPGSTR